MMSKSPLNILVAVTAILGLSVATGLAATTDDKVAQAPSAQSAPAAEAPAQAKPADDKASANPAAETTATTSEKPAGEKSARSTMQKPRAAVRPLAPARTTRVVRRDYYRVAQSADPERMNRGCFLWCGRVLYIGIGY
jgi:uncharacterized membrane protein